MWHYLRTLVIGVATLFMFVPTAEACKIEDKVKFERFVKVSHLSSSGVNLWVDITNDSCHRLVIKEMELDIEIKGKSVATISLRDKVVLPRKSTSCVLIPLRFTSHSTFVLARLLWKIVDGLGEDISISYRAKAGVRLIKRRFAGDNIPVSEILTNFAISKLRLRELIDML